MAELKLSLTNDLSEIERLSEAVAAFADTANIDPKQMFRLNLALEELITNTINYGFEAGSDQRIDVSLTSDGRTVSVAIEDGGRAFDPLLDVQPPDLDADVDGREIGGLGVHFVRELTDNLAYQRIGERNRLSFSLGCQS